MAQTTLIGIDVGTTATKAVLIGADGMLLARYSNPHPTHRPAPGFAEQDPADWMSGVVGALTTFADEHDLGGLAGIGLCSQVNTHVFVDGAGRPVLPAIVWQDTRAAAVAAELDAAIAPDDKLRWFGAPIPIDASNALSRMAYVHRHHPEAWAKTAHVLLPKDYCILQLTGAVVADPIAAIGLAGSDGRYVGPLLDRLPGAEQRLAPLRGFSDVAGMVKAGLPCAGVPVVVGAMDAWAGMFGVGVVADGDAMYQSGTSEIPGVVSATVAPTPGVVVFPPYAGITMHAAPTQSGGASLAWIAGVIGHDPAALAELASSASPEATPLFLPHLAGERAPIWDSDTRGVFARLETRAGAPELVRAVMEGVAFSVVWAFEALQKSAGGTVTVANLGGGGAKSDLWCQIRADALGFPLRRAAVSDAAAMGAAILAGVGSAAMPSLAQATKGLVGFDRTFDPDPSKRAYYDDKYARFRSLYGALRDFNAGH